MNAAANEHVWFDVRVTPNRAMSQRGLALIGIALLAPASLFGVVMFALKAWPATLFLGGEAGLAVVALYWCAKRLAEQQERIVLTDAALVIEAWDQGRPVSYERIEPTWARVERCVHADFGCQAVFVRTREKRVLIAQALSPAERADFADALEYALNRRKRGRFRTAA